MNEQPVIAPELSILIPVYNEAASLEPLYREIIQVIDVLGSVCEIIFIDDGSADESFSVITQLHEKDDRVRGIQLLRNFGKSAVYTTGFQEAQGRVIITLDADLQDDPMEIPKLLAALDTGLDVVVGWKYPRHDPWSKTIPSRVINTLTSVMTGLRLHDMNCGFKVYRQAAAKSLSLYGEQYRFIPAITHERGFRVGEVQVHHRPRKFGRSKYGIKRYFTGFLDLITILFITRFFRKPLHLFGFIGALQFIIGTGIVTYLLVVRLIHGSILNRHPLLIGAVMLSLMGLQFITTGLLAEMITLLSQSRERYGDLIRCQLHNRHDK